VGDLGIIKHWVLRFERGDGLLPKKVEDEVATEGGEAEEVVEEAVEDGHREGMMRWK